MQALVDRLNGLCCLRGSVELQRLFVKQICQEWLQIKASCYQGLGTTLHYVVKRLVIDISCTLDIEQE